MGCYGCVCVLQPSVYDEAQSPGGDGFYSCPVGKGESSVSSAVGCYGCVCVLQPSVYDEAHSLLVVMGSIAALLARGSLLCLLQWDVMAVCASCSPVSMMKPTVSWW